MIVVPKVDFNILQEEKDEWIESLRDSEREAIKVIHDSFLKLPLGCIAISQLLPKNISKSMHPDVKEILHKKFSILRNLTLSC